MNWLTIKNVHGEEGSERRASIWIDGPIGFKDWLDDTGTVAAEFIKTVDALGELAYLDIFMNTPGGVISDGVTITNYLINHQASISVTVMGQAASIGSVIAQAADEGKLHMALGSTMFVHDPLTCICGDADDMRWAAGLLDKMRDSIVAIYQRRTDLSESEIHQLLKDDTTMTAEDAVEWGFADSMDAELKAVAFHGLQSTIEAAKTAAKTFLKQPGNSEHNKLEASEVDPKNITVAYIGEHHAEVAMALRNEGIETGREEGATVERERIQAVRAQTMPGHEDLITELAFDGKTTGPEAAVKVLQAEKKNKKKAIANIDDDAAELNKVKSTVNAGLEANALLENMPLEDKCKAKWDASAELRAEFGDKFSTYFAYEKGMEKGGKVLGKTK
jgi:ATP-dependent Clp endopeptidase proteolytic subunit ClpP